MRPLDISIRWRSVEHGGLEQLRLTEWGGAIRANGAIVGQAGEKRLGVLYQISLTPDWRFESILLQGIDGRVSVLTRDSADRWYDTQSEQIAALLGCTDIDFEMTPFTNTLPISRAPLAIGETRRFRLAYIPAGNFEPFPTEQIYTRLEERLYRFETADGSFSADIAVDEDGLVTDYPGLFVRD